MRRLVIAVVILILGLAGWKFVSSPFFQRNILNRIGASSQTQTTGFNTTVPTDISTPTSEQTDTTTPTEPVTAVKDTTVKSASNTPGNGNSGSANPNRTIPATKPARPRAIQAAW